MIDFRLPVGASAQVLRGHAACLENLILSFHSGVKDEVSPAFPFRSAHPLHYDSGSLGSRKKGRK